MAGLFASASSQYLSNAAPAFTGYPFTFGVWIYLSATGTRRGVINVTSSSGDQVYLESSDASLATISHLNGGLRRAGGSATALVAAKWNFIVWRCISATNRRLSEMTAAGAISSAQDTTSTTLTAPTIEVGRRNTSTDFPGSEWDGFMGEFWYTNSDIQSDATQLKDDTVRQLAFGGPFSVPHVAASVIDYRSMRTNPTYDQIGETYYSNGIKTWTNNAGVTTGQHPPLPYWYVKPGQNQTLLMV